MLRNCHEADPKFCMLASGNLLILAITYDIMEQTIAVGEGKSIKLTI